MSRRDRLLYVRNLRTPGKPASRLFHSPAEVVPNTSEVVPNASEVVPNECEVVPKFNEVWVNSNE